MSDVTDGNAPSSLVSYFENYAPSRFIKKNGKPVHLRQQQINIRKFGLPIIETTKGNPLIDPVAGDNRLRELALQPQTPRRPGRPAGKAVAPPDRPIVHGRLRGAG
jgi:hypothetical protein